MDAETWLVESRYGIGLTRLPNIFRGAAGILLNGLSHVAYVAFGFVGSDM